MKKIYIVALVLAMAVIGTGCAKTDYPLRTNFAVCGVDFDLTGPAPHASEAYYDTLNVVVRGPGQGICFVMWIDTDKDQIYDESTELAPVALSYADEICVDYTFKKEVHIAQGEQIGIKVRYQGQEEACGTQSLLLEKQAEPQFCDETGCYDEEGNPYPDDTTYPAGVTE